MARPAFIIFAAFALAACVGDSSQPTDGGSDVTTSDAAPDTSADAAPPIGTCVFGTSHFDDGCKFGP
jgi:hypothetical protein